MKNIKYLLLFLITTLFFIGCEEDDTSLVETNHRIIVTSEMNFENTINPGDHIDFADISRGVKSRTWTFPEEAEISRISGEEGNTSSNNSIKGFFFKPGVYNVVLNQVFNGNVYPNEDSTEPLSLAELDTTIVVTVLDRISSVLEAHYVNDDGSIGEKLTMSDNAENEINASKSIQLSYTSTGLPEEITWDLEGAKPSEVKNPEGPTNVVYSKLGTHDLQFIASRNRPTDKDTIIIKNFIKVLPSTDPVTINRIFEKDDSNKNIGLEFSREMDPETVNRNDFSVVIETANGATLNPAIKNVTVDADEGNILVVELESEVMYNDDIINVTYTPGNLKTLDFVSATTFTEELTEFIKVNILEQDGVAMDASFENVVDGDWTHPGWGSPYSINDFSHSISIDNARTGDKSLYGNVNAAGGMIVSNPTGTFPVESGIDYEIGVWVYVEDLGSPGSASMDVKLYWEPGTDWGIPDSPFIQADFPTGEWVYSSFIRQFNATQDVNFMIRINNTANSEPLKIFLDDLSLFKLTTRP